MSLLYAIASIISIGLFVGGTFLFLVHLLVICPVMEYRAKRSGNTESQFVYQEPDDMLFFKWSMGMAVVGFILCLLLGVAMGVRE